ncbi:MAG: hypothetical protein QOE94_2932 [Mycobacterium sp.]|nr:hypothetical protein [Mycobacterium sp.]
MRLAPLSSTTLVARDVPLFVRSPRGLVGNGFDMSEGTPSNRFASPADTH